MKWISWEKHVCPLFLEQSQKRPKSLAEEDDETMLCKRVVTKARAIIAQRTFFSTLWDTLHNVQYSNNDRKKHLFRVELWYRYDKKRYYLQVTLL
jgi:hypothetical protein